MVSSSTLRWSTCQLPVEGGETGFGAQICCRSQPRIVELLVHLFPGGCNGARHRHTAVVHGWLGVEKCDAHSPDFAAGFGRFSHVAGCRVSGEKLAWGGRASNRHHGKPSLWVSASPTESQMTSSLVVCDMVGSMKQRRALSAISEAG